MHGLGEPACGHHPAEVPLPHAVLPGDTEVQGTGCPDKRLDDERLARRDVRETETAVRHPEAGSVVKGLHTSGREHVACDRQREAPCGEGLHVVRACRGGQHGRVPLRHGLHSHETARRLLRGYCGTIQTDGYGAYDQFETDPHIRVIGCWAHARRKWSDALDEDRRTASEALSCINRLYHIENEAEEAGVTGDALKERRQKEAYPVILQFEKWMYETATRSSQNSRIGKAIGHTLPLLPRLGRYVNDGRFRIDNNLVENAIRPLAPGRKNFLFCGNHDAAERAAIVYSLVDSCKALDIDPREWMEDVLLRIPGNENNREALRELLPDRWTKQTK